MNATFDTAGNRSRTITLAQATRTITLAYTGHPAVGKNKLYPAVTTGSLPRVRVGRRLAIPADTPGASVANGSPANEGG